jgi:hypothetical protein
MPIRDSRTLYGPQPHATTTEVEEHWVAFGMKCGWWDPELGVRVPGGKVTYSDTPVVAFVSDNRWVAQCSCGGGMGCWAEMPRACCYDCGTSYPVVFPDPVTLAAGEAVLDARPEPDTRNWRPDEETVADLKVENITRAVMWDLPDGGVVDGVD